VAFLSRIAPAIARAFALDSSTIAVLHVESLLNYIRFNGGGQQVRHAPVLPDSTSNIGGRHLARWNAQEGQAHSIHNRTIKSVPLACIQGVQSFPRHSGDERQGRESAERHGRAGKNDKVTGTEEERRFFPGEEIDKRIEADDKKQVCVGPVHFLKRADRVNRVGFSCATKLDIRDRKGGMPLDRQPDHDLAMCGRRQSMVLFVWRIAGRNEEDTIQLHGVACLSGDGEMATVDRIEGSAEKSQTHDRRSHCEPTGKLRMKGIISRE
jgi:hypothetical protein